MAQHKDKYELIVLRCVGFSRKTSFWHSVKSSQRHSILWVLEIPSWPLRQCKKNENFFVFWSDKNLFSDWNCSLSHPYTSYSATTDFSLIPVLSDLIGPNVFYCYGVRTRNFQYVSAWQINLSPSSHYAICYLRTPFALGYFFTSKTVFCNMHFVLLQ